MRNISFFDGASSGTVPTIGNIVASNLVQYADDAAFEAAELGAPTTGNIYYNTTLNLIRYYNGTSWQTVLDNDATQVVENKTIDGTAATGNNTVTTDADDVTYDNSTSSMVATDVQAAVDEVEARVDTNESDIDDLETLSGSAGATDHGTFTGTTIPDTSTTKGALQSLETEVELKEDVANKGIAGGYASLDGGGKVPSSQLPDTLMEYQGTWNASTNTPTLADGIGNAGDVYDVQVAGTQDLGSGSQTFAVGDWAVYNGTIWEKSDNSDAVTSVNGFSGIVTLDTDDIPEGSTNEYYTEAKVSANTDVAANTAKVSFPEAPVDGNQYARKDAGWEQVESGSGQGGINYVVNPDAEVDASGTGTDGSGNVTISLQTFNTTVPRGQQCFTVGYGSSTLIGQYAEWDLNTIDNFDIGEMLNVSFDWSVGPNYSPGDLQVILRDNTLATDLVVEDDNGGLLNAPGGLSNQFGKFAGRVQLSNTGSDYSLRIVSTVNRASAISARFDSLKLSPDTLVPGAILTKTKQFTPTGSWTTNTTYSGNYYRSGDRLIMDVTVSLSGGGPNPAFLLIDIPFGLSIDANKIDTSGSGIGLGYGGLFDTGVYVGNASPRYSSATQIEVRGNSTVSPYAYNGLSATSPFTWADGDYVNVTINVPIEGWSAGALLSTTEANYSTPYFAGTVTSNQNIINNTEQFIAFQGESLNKNFTQSGSATNWELKPASGGIFEANMHVRLDTVTGWQEGEVSFSRIFVYDKDDVLFNTLYIKYEEQNATSTTGIYKTVDGTAPIFEIPEGGYIKVTLFQNSDGNIILAASGINNFSIKKVQDFHTFSVYGKNEYVNSDSDPYTPTADSVWGQLNGNSITLPPGSWMINGGVDFGRSGAANYTRMRARWASVNGNNTATTPTGLTNIVAGRDEFDFFPNTNTVESNITMGTIRVVTSVETTIYLVPIATLGTFANGRINTNIYAERIA